MGKDLRFTINVEENEQMFFSNDKLEDCQTLEMDNDEFVVT